MNTNFLTLILFLISIQFAGYSQTVLNPVDYVDNRIGTANDGSNCVIGPQLPFGSINPSPQTPNGSHDGYDPTQPIRGFGQLHVSGTGWGKYGQIFLSPQIGLAIGEKQHDSPKAIEVALPYEYGVTLTRYNIRTSVTPSYHSALYKFTYPQSDSSHLLLDLTHNLPLDIATEVGGQILAGSVSYDSIKNTIRGFGRYNGGFVGGEYTVYFFAQLNTKPVGFGTWNKGIITENKAVETVTQTNNRVGTYLRFKTNANDTVFMKIAVSFKSIEQAESWLNAEIPQWNYSLIREKAKTDWNNELTKIKVDGGTDTDKKIFYTALYHSMLMPRNRTNDKQGFSKTAAYWDDHFAVWDTWRTVFPLMCLINPQMVSSNVNAFIERFKKNKRVKDAFVAGNDMPEEQGGNNIDNIIADAYTKDIPDIDWEAAYALLKFNADKDRAGWQGWGNFGITDATMGSYKKIGWIPAGVMSCSKTLEYAYNDHCASLVAEGLGKTADQKTYSDRSRKWTNLYNQEASSDGFKGFIVPKKLDGSFVNIDLKEKWGSWNNYFYEASSWTYSCFVPHQFDKLVFLSGSKEEYAKRLDYGFKNDLIDYGNEPAFLAAQVFHYAARPDLASYWTRKLISTKYSLKGVPGNDDSGAMSSLYIFSAMGFVPNAGQDIYYLTGSMYKKVELSMANDKRLIIESENASNENIYIQSCTINGVEWEKSWFSYKDIRDGAIIKFEMGKQPSDWAKTDTSLNYQQTTNLKQLKKNKAESYISPNHPNPFHGTTSFDLNIPNKVQQAQLNISNLQGKVVRNINISERGNSSINLSGKAIYPGFYFYSLICDGEIIGKGKMVKNDDNF